MGMNIKSDEAHCLAREIADRTGTSLTDAVIAALREKRQRLHDDGSKAALAERLLAYGKRFRAAHPDATSSTDEFYDEIGLPR